MTDLFSVNPDPAGASQETPKPRRTRTKKQPAAATHDVADGVAGVVSASEPPVSEPAKPRRTRAKKAAPAAAEQAPAVSQPAEALAAPEAETPAPAKPRRSRAKKPAAPGAEASTAEAPAASAPVAPVAEEPVAEAAAPEKAPRPRRSRKPRAVPAQEAEAEQAAPEQAVFGDASDGEAETGAAGEGAAQPSRSARRRSRKSRNKKRAAETPVEHNPVVQVPGMGLFAPASMVALVSDPLHLPLVAAATAPAVRTSQPPMVQQADARSDAADVVSAGIEDDVLAASGADDATAGEAATPGKRRRSRRGGRGRKRGGQNGQSESGEPLVQADVQAEDGVDDQAVAGDDDTPLKPEAAPATFFGEAAHDVGDDEADDEDGLAEGIGGTVLAASAEGDGSRKSSRSRNRRRASAARKAAAAAAEEARKSEVSEAEKARGRKMLISVQPDAQVEVVLTHEGVVQEYYIEMVHQAKIRGNIYKGVINNVDTNLQAAFVSFGQTKNGFLQIDEIHPEYWLTHHDPVKGQKYPPIQKVVKVGQEVLVQVVKEPTGNKGAFLTTWVSLAGRFLVLTPGQEQIGISRKVEDGEERNRLRELIKGIEPGPGLGAIVRTVSAGTSKTTLQKDLNFLKRVWKDIRKRATVEKAPCLIYQEPGLATRAVRDYLSDDVAEIWVDDKDTAIAINDMASLLFPRKGGEAELVSLYEDNGQTLWEHFNIQRQLDEVHAREVILPSGGRLVFDQTEALMAIDINSGKISGKTNFGSMAHRTNMEAAEAIARQLRLRDIGGQIVIDFIEMRDPKHCQEVEKTLRTAMKSDRARHDVARMSSFGLLEIVRQRTGSSAISITQEPCPHCNGTGMRRNMEWQALHTLRELRRELRKAATAGQAEYLYTAQPEVAVYLLNNKRAHLAALEKEFGLRLEIRIAGI